MRVLQSRVGELECSVDNLQRERTIILKELDNLTSEKQIILTNLEESNGKLNLLEQANRNYKAEIKELTRKV
jgi:DNA repair ATPase RecN